MNTGAGKGREQGMLLQQSIRAEYWWILVILSLLFGKEVA